MNNTASVAVCSRSFSQNSVLKQELLGRFSNVRFNDSGKQLEGSELIEFLKGADRAIVALERITEEVLSSLPDLKIIGKYGVGLDKLDFQAMHKHNVMLGWTPGVNAQSVAELTLAMALTIVRNIQVSNDLVKSGGWKQVQGKQLSSMTYGILGCGHVGKKLVHLLRPFGCQILACDIIDQSDFYKAHGVRSVSLNDLLTQSDVLSIHIPQNEKTRLLFNQENLGLMKKGSYLVNTARGGLVDESSLYEYLMSGHLKAAAFDVFEQEPPFQKELILLPQFYATSHIGGSSEEAILAMGRAAIQGLTDFQDVMNYEKYR